MCGFLPFWLKSPIVHRNVTSFNCFFSFSNTPWELLPLSFLLFCCCYCSQNEGRNTSLYEIEGIWVSDSGFKKKKKKISSMWILRSDGVAQMWANSMCIFIHLLWPPPFNNNIYVQCLFPCPPPSPAFFKLLIKVIASGDCLWHSHFPTPLILFTTNP